MIKKLREVRETNGLELDQVEAEPTIGRSFKTKLEIPNENSESILITENDFILSDRTSAICITADMSFKSRLETDFEREYQNVEFLFRRRPGIGRNGCASSLSFTSSGQIPVLFSNKGQ